MKTVKIIISLVLIIALISSFVSVPACAAVDPVTVAVGSGLAALIASLLGIDYITNNVNTQGIIDFFGKYSPQNPDIVSFTLDVINNPVGTISTFINKEFFKWLIGTNENIADEFNMQDNSQGGLVDGVGIYNDVPIFRDGNVIRSNYVYLNRDSPVQLGGFTFEYRTSGQIFWKHSSESTFHNSNVALGSSSFPCRLYIRDVSTTSRYARVYVKPANYQTDWTNFQIYGPSNYIEQGFTIDYETGILDFTVADDLPSTGGAVITAPAPSEPLDVEGIIKYLIDLLLNNPEELEVEIVTEEPAPDTGPTIADTPFIDLIGLFRNLGDKIEDIVQDVIGLSGTLTNTIENGFTDVIGLFEDVGETITDIYDTVVEKVGSIDLSIDSILEAVQSIVQSIETAAVDLFSDFLSAIQSIFAPILGRIRSALGIWHYVVEWLNCIGGVFAWIFGLCSGTAYCMVVPIYASIAAAICIALYKRFGR